MSGGKSLLVAAGATDVAGVVAAALVGVVAALNLFAKPAWAANMMDAWMPPTPPFRHPRYSRPGGM